MKTSRIPGISALIRQAEEDFASGRAPSELEQKLDNDLSELEHATRQLRVIRNACRPLLRLPSETLGEIIMILASESPPATGYLTQSTYTEANHEKNRRQPSFRLGWVLLGHVCRGLRNALLARGDLWAKDICNISRQPESIIPYCGNAPLHIKIFRRNDRTGSRQLQAAFFDFFTKHLESSQVISIGEWGRKNATSVFDCLDPTMFSNFTFPHLTSLLLESCSASIFHEHEYSFNLPEMIAPNLRSLQLRDYMISFNPSTLTSLNIRFTVPTYIYTPVAFLDILRRCSLLRSLKLCCCIPMLSEDTTQPVTMPSLEDIDVTDIVHRCLNLISHLVTSTSTRYSIDCYSIYHEFVELPAYLDALAARLELQRGTDPIVGLKIDTGYSPNSSFSIYQAAPPIEPDPSDTGEAVYLSPFHPRSGYREQTGCRFEFRGGEPLLAQITSHLHNAVDLTSIETLQITQAIHQSYDEAFWAETMTRFPNVATLCYTRMEDSSAHITALEVPTLQNENAESTIVLPRLQYLWIDVLDLREYYLKTVARAVDCARLLRVLSSRQRAGRPIERLRIKLMLVDSVTEARMTIIPRLEEFVRQVEIEDIEKRNFDWCVY